MSARYAACGILLACGAFRLPQADARNYRPGETDIRQPLETYLRNALPDVNFEFVEYHRSGG